MASCRLIVTFAVKGGAPPDLRDTHDCSRRLVRCAQLTKFPEVPLPGDEVEINVGGKGRVCLKVTHRVFAGDETVMIQFSQLQADAIEVTADELKNSRWVQLE